MLTVFIKLFIFILPDFKLFIFLLPIFELLMFLSYLFLNCWCSFLTCFWTVDVLLQDYLTVSVAFGHDVQGLWNTSVKPKLPWTWRVVVNWNKNSLGSVICVFYIGFPEGFTYQNSANLILWNFNLFVNHSRK